MRLEHLLSGERPSPCPYGGGNIHWEKALQTKGRDRKLEGSSCRDLSVPERRKRDGVSRKNDTAEEKRKTMYETYSSRKRESWIRSIFGKNRIRQTVFFRGNAEEGEKERERRHVPVKGIPSEGEMPTNKPASPIAQLVRALH